MSFMIFTRVKQVKCVHQNHQFDIPGKPELVWRFAVPRAGKCSIEDIISSIGKKN